MESASTQREATYVSVQQDGLGTDVNEVSMKSPQNS